MLVNLAEFCNWEEGRGKREEGRQFTGYQKSWFINLPLERKALLELCQGYDKMLNAHDSYLLKYPKGFYISLHKDDTLFGSEHWRLNALIQKGQGGHLKINGELVPLNEGDAVVFRPDLFEHEISEIIDGTRYVFTVGMLK